MVERVETVPVEGLVGNAIDKGEVPEEGLPPAEKSTEGPEDVPEVPQSPSQ